MIFNLFKSKPTLNELIPKGFVDIHSHVLPGIDDGAKNVEESIKLINNMKEMGFSKIIGTPHTYTGLYDNTNTTIKNSYNSIINHLDNNIIIEYASEYFLDDSIIEKAEKKTLLCVKDNYVLVETNFVSKPIGLYEIIFELTVNGYVPVLAHPERYLFLHNNYKENYKLKDSGCEFQINLFSTTGLYGNIIAKFSDKLINDNLIDYAGTDIHRNQHLKKFNDLVIIKNTLKLENVIKNNLKFM